MKNIEILFKALTCGLEVQIGNTGYILAEDIETHNTILMRKRRKRLLGGPIIEETSKANIAFDAFIDALNGVSAIHVIALQETLAAAEAQPLHWHDEDCVESQTIAQSQTRAQSGQANVDTTITNATNTNTLETLTWKNTYPIYPSAQNMRR